MDTADSNDRTTNMSLTAPYPTFLHTSLGHHTISTISSNFFFFFDKHKYCYSVTGAAATSKQIQIPSSLSLNSSQPCLEHKYGKVLILSSRQSSPL